MASIIIRGNKLYIRQWDRIAGKNIDKATGLKNDREGLRKANQQKKLLEANLLDKYYSINTIIKNKLSIDEAAKIFSETKKHSAATTGSIKLAVSHLKKATKKNYASEFDRMDFRKFSNYLSTAEKNGVPFSANTKSIYSRALRSLFSWMVTEKYVKENLVILEKGESKQIEIIPDKIFSEIKNFLYDNNKDAYYFVRMLELTGLRKSSALALTWEQIDFEMKIICIENVKKSRQFIFPLSDEIILLLNEIGKKESGRIFSYSKSGLKFWYRVQDKLGIEKYYGLHQIRKTFISNLANSGVSLYDVATLADHRSIQTTYKYYAKSNIERLRGVLNVNNSKPSLETSLEIASERTGFKQ